MSLKVPSTYSLPKLIASSLYFRLAKIKQMQCRLILNEVNCKTTTLARNCRDFSNNFRASEMKTNEGIFPQKTFRLSHRSSFQRLRSFSLSSQCQSFGDTRDHTLKRSLISHVMLHTSMRSTLALRSKYFSAANETCHAHS